GPGAPSVRSLPAGEGPGGGARPPPRRSPPSLSRSRASAGASAAAWSPASPALRRRSASAPGSPRSAPSRSARPWTRPTTSSGRSASRSTPSIWTGSPAGASSCARPAAGRSSSPSTGSNATSIHPTSSWPTRSARARWPGGWGDSTPPSRRRPQTRRWRPPGGDPPSIRRPSRRLGLHTDASHRFERGADPEAIPEALNRAAAILLESAGGTLASGWIDARGAAWKTRHAALRLKRLKLLAGSEDIDLEFAAEALARLGFAAGKRSRHRIAVTVPSWRPDVAIDDDLVEEGLRIPRYDRPP